MARKIIARHPARMPFGPRKIVFGTGCGAGGTGSTDDGRDPSGGKLGTGSDMPCFLSTLPADFHVQIQIQPYPTRQPKGLRNTFSPATADSDKSRQNWELSYTAQ